MATDLHQHVVDKNLELWAILAERNVAPTKELLHDIVLELLVDAIYSDATARSMFQHAVDVKLHAALLVMVRETECPDTESPTVG